MGGAGGTSVEDDNVSKEKVFANSSRIGEDGMTVRDGDDDSSVDGCCGTASAGRQRDARTLG